MICEQKNVFLQNGMSLLKLIFYLTFEQENLTMLEATRPVFNSTTTRGTHGTISLAVISSMVTFA